MAAFHPLPTFGGCRIPAVMRAQSMTLMRMSLWVLLAGALAVSIGWIWLVVLSGFQIWRESNAAGLALQGAFLLSPLALLFGLKSSQGSFVRTTMIFAASWTVAVAMLVFFRAL